MANRFDIKLNNLKRSVSGIKNTIQIKELSLNDKKSILYDFGGCEEQTWKLFKYYLEYIEGYENLGIASKKIYRTVKDIGVISDDECLTFLETIDLRNRLFHEYDYENLNDSCDSIVKYLDIFNRAIEIFEKIRIDYKDELEKDII